MLNSYYFKLAGIVFILLFFSFQIHGGDIESIVLIEYDHIDILEEEQIVIFDHLNEQIIAGISKDDYYRLLRRGIDFEYLDDDPYSSKYYIINIERALDWESIKKDIEILFQDEYDILIKAPVNVAEELAFHRIQIRKVFLSPKPYRAHIDSREKMAISHDPLIQEIIDSITTESVYYYCGSLSGEWPVIIDGEEYTITSRNSYYTEGIEKATQYSYEFFEELGLEAEYHYFPGPGERNVIAKQQGTVYPDSYYMICGHLDSLPSGAVAPGADDNASGSTAVMLAAELLNSYDFEYSIIYALWTGEEQGLIGSGYYAQDIANAGKDLRGVINLDMIAWESTGNPVITLHARASDIPYSLVIANAMADSIDVYDLDLEPMILSNGMGYSDHASFWSQGYAAILGIEDFYNDFNPYYHTVNDLLEHLNLEYFRDFTKASIATLIHFAGIMGEIVYGIDLDYFTVSRSLFNVDIAWQTSYEENLSGFNLYRFRLRSISFGKASFLMIDPVSAKINDDLIPAQGGISNPYTYSFIDYIIHKGVYLYSLEAVYANDETERWRTNLIWN